MEEDYADESHIPVEGDISREDTSTGFETPKKKDSSIRTETGASRSGHYIAQFSTLFQFNFGK